MRKNHVRDWMTPFPVTITPKTTVQNAYKLMKERNIRRLPVLREGKLVGIVTWGDLREASASDASSLSVWELNYLLTQLTVDEVMTKTVYTVRTDDTIEDAARKMLQHKLGGLPVLDASGAVVGIITESDIFRMVVRQWELDEEPMPA